MVEVIVRDARFCRCEGPDNLCAWCEEQSLRIPLDTCLQHRCGHDRPTHSDDGRCTGTIFNAGFFASSKSRIPCSCLAYRDDSRDEST